MDGKWIACAALAFASAGQALAQDDEQEGVYVGGGIGEFSSALDLSAANIDFDEDESAYKLFVGWRFNQFLAVQLDYLDLGRTDSPVGLENLDVKTRGYAARIEGTLPLAFFELFATAGLIYSSVEANLGGSEVFDESDNAPVYSVGAGLEVAERLVLRLEYEIIDIDTFDDAEAIWLSVAWRL